MVGVAVVLAAIIGAFVMGMGSGTQPTPAVDISVDLSEGDADAGEYAKLTISHSGGEVVTDENTLRVLLSSYREAGRGPSAVWAGQRNLSYPAYVNLAEGDTLAAGDSITLHLTPDDRTFSPGDTIKVVWVGPDKSQSDIIKEYTIPETTETYDPSAPSTCYVDQEAKSPTYSGSGTSADPYEISNLTQLQCMANHDSGASYELTQTLNATETQNWNGGAGFRPITFNGELNGNGYSIQNLHINRPGESRVGLFGHIYGATVENIDITTASVTGGEATGIVVGAQSPASVIRDMKVTGTVTGTKFVGGVAGRGSQELRDLDVDVDVDADTHGGGVVGLLDLANAEPTGPHPVLSDITVSGTVDADRWGVGGVVGVSAKANYTHITNVTADVDVTGGESTGGFVGFVGMGGGATGIVIENSVAEGDVSGSRAGGFAGLVLGDVDIRGAEAHGTVTASHLAGGFAEELRGDVLVKNSLAAGNVSGELAGGFVADLYNNGTVIESEAHGDVSATDQAGGFVYSFGGSGGGEIRSSVATGEVTSDRLAGGFANYMHSNATITESVATGDVSASEDVGGFVNFVGNSYIRDSYANNKVTYTGTTSDFQMAGAFAAVLFSDTNSSYNSTVKLSSVYATGSLDTGGDGTGGIAADVMGSTSNITVSGGYWDTESTGLSESESATTYGTGLTTAEMTGTDAESNMPEFDWVEIWETVTGDYPQLRWES